jgi:hypothetical protein
LSDEVAEITPQIREKYKSWADSVPPDILAKIDEAELLDRLDEAASFRAKAAATASPVLRSGYLVQARGIIRAAPRAAVEARITDLLAKADGAATGQYRESCRSEAERLRAANHPAPRRHRPASTPPAAPVRRVLVKAASDAAISDPDAPVTREWLEKTVRAELRSARADVARQAREVQLDGEALAGASEAAVELMKAPGPGSAVLYK